MLEGKPFILLRKGILLSIKKSLTNRKFYDEKTIDYGRGNLMMRRGFDYAKGGNSLQEESAIIQNVVAGKQANPTGSTGPTKNQIQQVQLVQLVQGIAGPFCRHIPLIERRPTQSDRKVVCKFSFCLVPRRTNANTNAKSGRNVKTN